jgi:hypothetical protein
VGRNDYCLKLLCFRPTWIIVAQHETIKTAQPCACLLSEDFPAAATSYLTQAYPVRTLEVRLPFLPHGNSVASKEPSAVTAPADLLTSHILEELRQYCACV